VVTELAYCRHCEEQIESCLAAARDAQKTWIRTYFLTLAGKWTRLSRDLEDNDFCGSDCPLRKACGRRKEPAAQPEVEDASRVAVA
jgi:hypothetical protein